MAPMKDAFVQIVANVNIALTSNDGGDSALKQCCAKCRCPESLICVQYVVFLGCSNLRACTADR